MPYRVVAKAGLSYVVEDPDGPHAAWDAARVELLRLLLRTAQRATERAVVAHAATTFEEYRQEEGRLDSGNRQTGP